MPLSHNYLGRSDHANDKRFIRFRKQGLVDAVEHLDESFKFERLLGWHEKLFPEGDTLFNSVIGGQWRGDAPLQVVSGRIDRPVVHFEAPPRAVLEDELSRFEDWFNESKTDALLVPLLRAAITHLWFVTLHPLDDGNGRITRLLTDLALAQADKLSVRFYAMSVGIMANRKSYYEILESTQKVDLDITQWLVWFCKVLNETFSNVLHDIEQTIQKVNYWRAVDQTKLTTEHMKVLNRMLDGELLDGINTSQYHKVAKVSKPTASRHLAYLVEVGCLQRSGSGGRSTRYILNQTAQNG